MAMDFKYNIQSLTAYRPPKFSRLWYPTLGGGTLSCGILGSSNLGCGILGYGILGCGILVVGCWVMVLYV